MNDATIRAELDKLVRETTAYNAAIIPQEMLENLSKWKWGSYGWVSPASLMFTATWRKYYYPEVDCCKIWADDERHQPIPGGYSIRTEDENISIPILAKYDLCQDFCSSNSGMQGSRAIEKMRNLKRLNKDFDAAQRTVFDLRLFAAIMNDINELSRDQLLELLRFLICTAKGIKAHRDTINAALAVETTKTFSVLDFLAATHDPEFTKCVVAACLHVLYSPQGINVSGVEDYKTAADARAKKPGDLTLEKDGVFLQAIEVKDKTQKIDWNNIERAKRIIANHPNLKSFMFVLENRNAATNSLINEMVTSPQLATPDGKLITIVSLLDIYRMAIPLTDEKNLISIIGRFITIAPAVKPETKNAWFKQISH